jgi:hypothetical protein
MDVKDSKDEGGGNDARAVGETTANKEQLGAKEGAPGARPRIALTESIMAAIKRRSIANPAAIPPLVTGGNDLEIARDYLLQHQEKSVRELAEQTLARAAFEPQIITTVTERLRHGRTAGPRHGFEDLLKLHCFWIEQVCTDLKIPLHGGVACGVG